MTKMEKLPDQVEELLYEAVVNLYTRQAGEGGGEVWTLTDLEVLSTIAEGVVVQIQELSGSIFIAFGSL